MASKVPSFDIPSLIPPLPSSSHGKENDKKVRNHKESHDISQKNESPGVLKSVSRPMLALRTPKPTPRQAPIGSAGRHLSPSPGSIGSTTTTKGRRRSVLRFGETTEFLFCITSESSHEHRQLARGIVDGSLADDPKAWEQVLKLTAQLKSTNGTDLIRLHRRATLRFPLDQMEAENRDDVLGIWLLFASIHVKLGMMDEARRTCRYMENQKIPLGASFYVELAKMEQQYDPKRSQEILLRGLTENAEPRSLLHDAFKGLHESTPRTAPVNSSLPPVSPKKMSLSPRKRKLESDSSPKRQKIETGFLEMDSEETNTKAPRELHLELPRQAMPASSKLNTKISSQPNLSSSSSQQAGPNKLLDGKPSALRSRPTRLVSRLNPKGLSGKPKRVEPETSMYQDSESEPENTCEEMMNDVDPSTVSNTSSQPVHKIKKMDLSYMWEWDPSTRGKTQESKPRKPSMEKIEEASAFSGQTTTASSQATNRSNGSTTTTTSSIEGKKTQSGNSSDAKEESHSYIGQENTHVDETETRATVERKNSTDDDVVAHANREFLPLVHENNILRVNGSSYVKLGVIGKGGSCKVYRALSKKCSVLAIKKVKLDGMDRKAIEGYANEISLLKRLRGNPAIIQMYDSEVDHDRKSIFVVMEVGEADLNHILQQRALSGSCRSLNMNFIRLTWQQMLNAVHCIHEERIIHSDLKPANFLFVRGALKLIDFGIAKAIQTDDTTNIYRESHIGTLNYMSPEAILDTETGSNGPRMRLGRVSAVNGVR